MATCRMQTNTLYVLQRNPTLWEHYCFEALIYGEGPESHFFLDWYGYYVSPPPHM